MCDSTRRVNDLVEVLDAISHRSRLSDEEILKRLTSEERQTFFELQKDCPGIRPSLGLFSDLR